MYVLTADLTPSVLKRIEEEGFVKGFGQMNSEVK
jgi:hypothetical protein